MFIFDWYKKYVCFVCIMPQNQNTLRYVNEMNKWYKLDEYNYHKIYEKE